MSEMADLLGIPKVIRWCPQCNGYGSSLKEASDRCSRCGGTGLVRRGESAESGPSERPRPEGADE